MGGLAIGSGTILAGIINQTGAENTIQFRGAGGIGGIIETVAPQPGPLTFNTAGANPISLNPGGPGIVSLGGNMELLANQRIIHAVAGALRVESAGVNDLRLNAANAGNILVAEGGGNVGLGTALPTARLHVAGSVRIVDGTQAVGRVLTSDANGLASWQTVAGAADSDWVILGADMFSGVPGNVGIGTGTPSFRLHVASGAGFAGDIFVVSTGTADVFRVQGDGDVLAGRYFGDGSQLTGIMAAVGAASALTSSTDVVVTADSDANGSGAVLFNAGALERMRLSNAGRLGIGTSSPDAALHVAGSIKMVDGNQAAGRILTSDAGGLARWESPAAAIGDNSITKNLLKTGSGIVAGSLSDLLGPSQTFYSSRPPTLTGGRRRVRTRDAPAHGAPINAPRRRGTRPAGSWRDRRGSG